MKAEWTKSKISDFVEITMGQSPKSEYYNFDGVGMPFLQGNRTFGRIRPTFDTWCSKPIRVAKNNSVIMSVRAPVGDLNITPLEICIGRGVCAFNNLSGSNSFLYYLLLANQTLIRSNENGTVFGSVNKKTIENIELLTTFNESTQVKVTQILSSLDDKIEINNKINCNLEELAQTLYKRWFVDFEFPNEEGKPYKSSGGEMVESELGLIPKGWEVFTLDDLSGDDKFSIVDGPFGTQMKIAEYTDSGIPIIEMNQLGGYEYVGDYKNFISIEKYEEVKRSTVMPGDIILSKTGTLGLLGTINSKYAKGVLVSRLAKITPNLELINSNTLLVMMHYLSNSGYWYQIASGSTMPLLNLGNIKKTKVVFTKSKKISFDFDLIAENVTSKINNNLKENANLGTLRDLLLPKLMSGEIEV